MATKCYNDYIKLLECELRKNPKVFWTYVKNKRGGSSQFPTSMSDGTTTSSEGQVICELFASYFSSVYSPINDENSKHRYDLLRNFENCSLNLNNIVIDLDMLLSKLKSIDINKGAGPDGIPPIFIRKTSSALGHPLMIIYRKSLSTGVFPSVWKTAKIVPIHKSDDKESVSNYRPISILSSFAKIFESLVCPYIQNHLKLYLSDDQHGFVARRSTSTNLIPYTEMLLMP